MPDALAFVDSYLTELRWPDPASVDGRRHLRATAPNYRAMSSPRAEAAVTLVVPTG